MSDFDQTLDRIRAPIISGRMTKRELARRAGLRDTVLIGMEAEDWNPHRRTLEALLRAVERRPLASAANQRSVAA